METLHIQSIEKRRVKLPYFAKRGTTYYWVASKSSMNLPIGHAVYSDGAIILNSSCAYDAFHKEAVEVTADEFWARWREAVAAPQAMEGGAE